MTSSDGSMEKRFDGRFSIVPNTTEYLDFSIVLDVRYGKYAKLPKNLETARNDLAGNFVIPASSFDCAFLTIISGNSSFVDLNFLTFLAPSADVAKEWGEAILSIATNLLSINGSVTHFINRAFAKMRYGLGDQVKVRDVVKLFASNREEKKAVEKALQVANIPLGKDGTVLTEKVTEETFFHLYRLVCQRNEVWRIFNELQITPTATGNPHHSTKKPAKSSEDTITAYQFVEFLNHEQRDPRLNEILYPYYTEKSARKLIEQYEPKEEHVRKDLLSIDGFLRYLLSDDNGVLAEEAFDLRTEDMNDPLSNYFINTSHNTYLIGPQYRSRSSVEMYRQTLLAGCRSIELDCWDRGDEPMITHGPAAITMVTQIPFKDVIEAIAESAFKTSEYPVILSFENHCSPRNQQKMAQYCKEIFGDSLLANPLPSYPIETGVPLPSPQLLKRKILIKNKKIETSQAPSRDASVRLKTRPAVERPSVIANVPEATPTAACPPSELSQDTTTITTKLLDPLARSASGPFSPADHQLQVSDGSESAAVETETESDVDEGVELEVEEAEIVDPSLGKILRDRQQATAEVGAEISELVNYMRAMGRFRGFEEAEKCNMSCQLFSLVELRALDLLKAKPVNFVNHNKRQITRVYPKGTRLDSSNYLPQAYWNAGCQMVALNFQTLDLPMQLNLGLFEMNGRCGYLLKPECMRKRDRYFDPFEENAVENIVANTVTVQIISGQLLSTLSERRLSTYVEVEMYGLSIDTQRRRFRTRTVQNNGINPAYMDRDSKPFEFKKVVLPDLATLRIVVNDENGRMLGHRILPVLGLRPGYRHLTLRNAANQALGLATLFVRIAVRDFVPEAYLDFANALVNPIAYVNEQQKHEEMLKQLIDDDDPALKGRLQKKEKPQQNGPASAAANPSVLLTVEQSLQLSKKASSPEMRSPVDSLRQNVSKQNSLPEQPSPVSMIADTPKKISISSPSSSKALCVQNKNVLEAYDFKLPTIDALLMEKKLEKLRKKQEELVDLLKATHIKERDRMLDKHIKKLQKLESIQDKTHFVLTRASKSLKRPDKTSLSESRAPVECIQAREREESTSKQHEEVSNHQVQEIMRMRNDHCKEVKTLTARHVTEIQSLLHEQEVQMKNAMISAADQTEKASIRTLECLYNREVNGLMKRNSEMRKQEVADMMKGVLTKEQFSKMKKEIQDRSIRSTLEQRRTMMMSKKQREEEISTYMEELREKIECRQTQNLQEKVTAKTEEYRKKMLEGVAIEITTL